MKMKTLTVFVLAVVVLGVVLQAEALPVIPPIPTLTPTPTPGPTPGPGQGGPSYPEYQQKFEIISAQPILEGYAGGTIDYEVKTVQKGYPDLVVHLTADVPDTWKVIFSKNDFDLTPEEAVELIVSLSVPENVKVETYEIKISAVGKAREDSLEARASAVLTAVTYLIDVGITNLQFSSFQPRPGENVTITALAVNYTQRVISNVAVEFLVNDNPVSEQTVTLLAGTSQSVIFGWTAQSGDAVFVVRSHTQGDFNRRNDSVTQMLTIGTGAERIDALFQQAQTLYYQGAYEQAQNLLSSVSAQYTAIGELTRAAEADRLQNLCTSYIEAQYQMDVGEQAFEMENYEEAAQHFGDALNLYITIGDTDKQVQAQERFDAAVAAQKPRVNILYVIAIAIGAVSLLAALIYRRLHTPERLPYPPGREFTSVSTPGGVSPEERPGKEVPPSELATFHQKTEDALNRLTEKYIRGNFSKAMQVYLSLEEEKKHVPRGEDPELERAIEANLRELENRILGTS